MVFPWHKYPQVIDIALQYIQDHVGSKTNENHWINIIKEVKHVIGESEGSSLTVGSFRQRMRVFVIHHRKDPEHNLKDLFLEGVHILDLDETEYCVNLVQDAGKFSIPTSPATQNTTESKGDDKITPKRKKTGQASTTPKHMLSDKDNDKEGNHDKPPFTKRRKQTPQKRLAINIEDGRKLTTRGISRKDLPGAKANRKSPATIHDTDDDLSSLPGSDTVEGEEPQEEDEEDEEDDEEKHVDKTEDYQHQRETVPAKSRKVNLKLGQTRVKRSDPLNPHIPSPYDLADRHRLGQRLQDNAEYEYDEPLHEDIVGHAYDTVELEHKMKELAIRIDETLDVELSARKIDGDQPFRLDENLYDQDGKRVLQRMFGYEWNMSDLKARINETQTSRRLPLRTFMQSFIGASVMLHALEPLPQGQIDERSTEYRLYAQACEYAGTLGAKMSTSDIAHQHYSDVARGYAVKNFIHRHFIPDIQTKAGELATELLSQLVVLYPAGAKWRSPNPGSLRPSSYRPDPPGSEPQSATSTIRGVKCDVFWHNLKNVFVHALTLRAAMEAAGNAVYDFKFHQFLSDFKPDIMQHNDLGTDLDEPHRVFVSVLPSIWARYRGNRTTPYPESFECITRGLVMLTD